MSQPLLIVEHLKKYFSTPNGILHAVDDVSFSINAGETLGVVGESGCGKSTLGRAILRLHEPTSGNVTFDGKNVLALNKSELKKMRTQMQLVFQDPFASLNPQQTVSQAIMEPLLVQRIYKKGNSADLNKKVAQMMDLTGLPKRLVNTYPHELDGGLRQRVGIARALALDPKFIVCDEPVSALDVSIQAQILNLMQDLQEEIGLTYMFITHDLSVVKHLSNDIIVMYLGQIVERASSKDLFKVPTHPYTKALISAIPTADPTHKMNRIILKGEITSPINPAPGCRFAKRCEFARPECFQNNPQPKEIEPGHFVSCHLA